MCLALITSMLVFGACTRGADIMPAASAETADAPRTLRLFVPGQQASLNPLLAATMSDQQLALLAYDVLLLPDPDNVLKPSLAAVVPTVGNGGISADGKTVTFRLRRGVRWHDGRPFTSADVAFTFAAIMDPRVNVPTRTGFDRIVRIATPDPYTVMVNLREPFAPFVANVGSQYAIVPKHLLEHSRDINTDPLGTQPVGTGPYRFKRWRRGDRIEYVANSEYFGGAPKIKTLSVNEIPDQNTAALALRTHQLDLGIVESSAFAQLRSAPDVRTTTEPNNDFVGYALNTTSPLLREVRVRRALSMLVDRAAITKAVTLRSGTPAYADLPALLWMPHEPANPYGYDRAAAEALLDAAGWRRGPAGVREKNGVPLALRGINFRGSKTGESIDVQVAQSLRAAGINWSTKYYSLALYYESAAEGGPVASGNFDTAAYSFVAGIDAENDEIYSCASREPDGFNAARYCSAAMDALQRDSLTSLDAVRRAADVVRIEKLAVTDVPYIFLYHTPKRLAWNPHLRRTRADLLDPWYDVQNWTFAAP